MYVVAVPFALAFGRLTALLVIATRLLAVHRVMEEIFREGGCPVVASLTVIRATCLAHLLLSEVLPLPDADSGFSERRACRDGSDFFVDVVVAAQDAGSDGLAVDLADPLRAVWEGPAQVACPRAGGAWGRDVGGAVHDDRRQCANAHAEPQSRQRA